MDLGITPQAISALKQKEALDKDMLEKIAKALKVSPEAIRILIRRMQFLISNIIMKGQPLNNSANYYQYYQPSFNPIDKYIEQSKRIKNFTNNF